MRNKYLRLQKKILRLHVHLPNFGAGERKIFGILGRFKGKKTKSKKSTLPQVVKFYTGLGTLVKVGPLQRL